jgi:hypothetical protein
MLRHDGASLVTNISNVIEYTAVAPGVNVGFVANAIFCEAAVPYPISSAPD